MLPFNAGVERLPGEATNVCGGMYESVMEAAIVQRSRSVASSPVSAKQVVGPALFLDTSLPRY